MRDLGNQSKPSLMSRAVRSLARLAKVTKSFVQTATQRADGESLYPTQQIDYLGKSTNSTAWYPYGFHAQAPVNALSVMLTPEGSGHIHLPGSPDKRLILLEGEVVMYRPQEAVLLPAALGEEIGNACFIALHSNDDINMFTTIGDVLVSGVNGSEVYTTSVSVLAPSITVGDGTNDVIALMAEMCQLVHDSAVFHNGDHPLMDTATRNAWDTLKAKVLTLA